MGENEAKGILQISIQETEFFFCLIWMNVRKRSEEVISVNNSGL